MSAVADDIASIHLLLGILQNVDVGLVVLDRDYRVRLWNGFMENHSGCSPSKVIGHNLFERFPDIPRDWLQRKIDGVFTLNNRAFTSWQQRPHLLEFTSYLPITGRSAAMYQNATLFPLRALNGEIGHVCLVIYDVTDMAMDEQELQAANAELERLGRTDGLTGLLNRRAWEEALETEYRRFQRYRHKSVLVMFDIDHFKRVNDNHGHPAGDEVIRAVSEALRRCKRDVDIAGRYGGEEFGVIMPDTDFAGGRFFAERLRRCVEGAPVVHDGAEIRYTISLGLAEVDSFEDGYAAWLTRTDQALYQSKEGGRNRVTVFGEEG